MNTNIARDEKILFVDFDGMQRSGFVFRGWVANGPESKDAVACLVQNFDTEEAYLVWLDEVDEHVFPIQ